MGLLFLVIAILCVLYLGTPRSTALVVISGASVLGLSLQHWSLGGLLITAPLLVLAFLLALPSQLRQQRLSQPLLAWVRGKLPSLSATEQQALDAGTVSWEGELFSGRPDWDKLLKLSHSQLSSEEQAFLDGPTEDLCAMLDNWAITHEHFDLPKPVWQFIRENGFWGLMLPKEYGGLEFSELAHSQIVMKIASRNIDAAVTVMVPNSLGPGQLLLRYGTETQKQTYLAKLASGEHIPCFALTSPVAGSDAGAIPDTGVICRGEWQGESVIGMRVTWNKRYITLAPVATLIGLAIKVYDPEQLLQGETRELGVTCVMIPSDLEGVHSGDRHMPLDSVFMNGPTWGDDVFIPLDYVIGGAEKIGKGWIMLLEVLSIGRSISLPALAASSGKMSCLSVGAYAAVREQFGRSISEFEGVQEALESIAGHTFLMDCARQFTASMLDRGERPSVPSALLKYHNTGLMREVVNNAMDVVAGRAVMTGPRNFLAPVYQAVPIAITVEGANILTRSLMTFGQGAIRCHPFIQQEIEAAGNADQASALAQFDAVFYQHLAHTTGNAVRAFVLGLSGARLTSARATGNIQRHYRQLSRFSAAFALLTDMGLLTLGGSLKARQRFSGRMADALTHQYYASAVIHNWHHLGYPEELRDLVEWSLQTSLFHLQDSLYRAASQFPLTSLRWPLRLLLFPAGLYVQRPSDELGQRVALSIVKPGPQRENLISGIFASSKKDDPVGRVLHAWQLARETQLLRKRIKNAFARADGECVDDLDLLLAHEWEQVLDCALQREVITKEERATASEAMTALYDLIRVDAFSAKDIAARAKAAKGKLKEVDRP